MNTWVCARAGVNAGLIISTTPTPYPNTSINYKNNMSKNRGEEGIHWLVSFHSLFKKKQKTSLYYEKTELKHRWLSVMFNGYMLEKLSFKIGSFFTYVMYITARVSHLHENGRLSERDKPKASSRELDVVFGIPSSAGFFLLSPRHCRISPLHHAFIFPIITQARSVLIIFSVQGLLKYCCNPVSPKQ